MIGITTWLAMINRLHGVIVANVALTQLGTFLPHVELFWYGIHFVPVDLYHVSFRKLTFITLSCFVEPKS